MSASSSSVSSLHFAARGSTEITGAGDPMDKMKIGKGSNKTASSENVGNPNTAPLGNSKGPIKQTFSQASMEYSVDSYPSGKGTTTDTSVGAGSLFSFTTQNTKEGTNGGRVPKDDDLRAIGWAKAYDPSSQSYYYYTLDRAKTSWENPLLAFAEAEI